MACILTSKAPGEDFAAMSEYSLDSLESVEDDSLEKHISVNSDNDDNLGTIKSDDRSSKNTSFQLNSTLTTLSQIKDNMTETNCTVREDRCTGTCRATREEPWLCIRKRNDVGERRRTGEGDESRRRCRRTSRPTTMATATTTTTETERCSPGARNSSSKCSLRDNRGGMRADKKLGNVLVPWIRGPARTTSYLELYRRRFNVPKYSRIQSPEGSTLSICGDSQLEELSLDEGCSSLPGTSRDDSELSFYRRFVEDHAVRVTRECTRRSCEILRHGITSNTVSLEEQCERSVSDSKLKKPTYRPYTIEEYRSLSVPRPDRSLGPDKDEVQAKSRRAIAQKCFLPPLKDWDATASKNRESSRILETNNVTQESLLKHPVMYPKKRITTDETSSFRESEMFEKTLSFDSSFNLYASCEDLETLQQCHLDETKLADRLMRQTLNS
ncbi:uncharacterized protein [Mycetomoellerius zeteki]|uniref:uncharacterized protein isoform X2 n=1 Tax=Mycetomoellerius zeteki TaxID=64791 RepID=UPI00084EC2B0|nr:PREDICTED: uncharacterized protein LOC108727750 isoform X2 [Trachymyrmex zeteki]